MSNRVNAWQCIGCGKIEAPQTCIGVCQDRKVEFVYASEHEEALAQLTSARTKMDALEAIAYQLAWTKPRTGEWEQSYRALSNALAKYWRQSTPLPRASRTRGKMNDGYGPVVTHSAI
jgi:hypothetical protein